MLEDLFTKDLRVVFCGTAAGTRSAQLQQYYAGRGNKFWKLLAQVGLTPKVLLPSEYRELLSFGIGLTDMVKGQSGGDADIDFKSAGRDELIDKIDRLTPKCLCFNGKRAAVVFLGQKIVEYGLQTDSVGATKIFVAPSTSGAANAFWDARRWQDLANLVNTL